MRALPVDIRAKLAELDLELSEGDITQKGYDKKRQRLLAPYIPAATEATPPPPEPSGSQQVCRPGTVHLGYMQLPFLSFCHFYRDRATGFIGFYTFTSSYPFTSGTSS